MRPGGRKRVARGVRASVSYWEKSLRTVRAVVSSRRNSERSARAVCCHWKQSANLLRRLCSQLKKTLRSVRAVCLRRNKTLRAVRRALSEWEQSLRTTGADFCERYGAAFVAIPPQGCRNKRGSDPPRRCRSGRPTARICAPAATAPDRPPAGASTDGSRARL